MVKILFICKYNRFRSKVAEVYLKKINSQVQVSSAGIFEVDIPYSPKERKRNNYILKKFNLNVIGKSKGLKVSTLENQDKIIVVANNIPRKIFSHKTWVNKIEFWPIPDEEGDNVNNINKSVNKIIKRINKLNRNLT